MRAAQFETAHESPNPQLTRASAPELCLQGHGLQMMEGSPTPPHEDLTRDCLLCHGAHGGQAAYYLLDGEPDDETGTVDTEPPEGAGES